MSADRPFFFGLLRRRQALCLSWRGRLLSLAAVALAIAFAALRIQPFLAVTDATPGGALVVEGWVPDYALKSALVLAKGGAYAPLLVTGEPLKIGEPLSAYKTYAELGAATLNQLGAFPSAQAVPATAVIRDRTYASALALRDWLRARGPLPAKLTLLTLGAHARRSRLLFEKVFGPGVKIGVIAVSNRDYDAARWWRFSEGFRNVTDEAIAYLYARFLFSPAAEASTSPNPASS